MADFDVDGLLRLAPTTNVDGYDLTVAEARAMSRELFARAFDFAALEEVPVVASGLSGPGIFEEAPPDAAWYIWRRPPPDPAKAKEAEKVKGKAGTGAGAKTRERARKQVAFLLVRRIPKHERAPGGKDRVFLTLKSRDVDAARLEVLVTAARAQRRTIHASTWPVERVAGLSSTDVLEVYKARNLQERGDGKPSGGRKKGTNDNILRAVKTFQRVFPGVRMGDLKGEWIADEYEVRTGCKATTRHADLKSVRKALRGGLTLIGVGDPDVDFANPDPGRADKRPWTPAEYDALVAATDGWATLPDGTRVMGKPFYAEQWKLGVPFLAWTASRHGLLPNIRWVPPWEEPSDGLPLAMCDRAWIEVTDGPIYFHRDGGMPYDSNKGRAGNLIPDEFAPVVRARFEADLALGKEFVFRRKDGGRYVGSHIGWYTFRKLVERAGIPWKRVAHHLKDLGKELAEAAGVRLESFAAHADTLAETLESTYGDGLRAALLQEAAEKISQTAWREKAAGRGAIVARFRRARADADNAEADKRRAETDKRRAEANKRRAATAKAPAGDKKAPTGFPSAEPAKAGPEGVAAAEASRPARPRPARPISARRAGTG